MFVYLDGVVSGSSPSHTKNFKDGTYCYSAFLSLSKGNAMAIKMRSSYLVKWTSKQRWCNSKSWLSDKIRGIWCLPIRVLSYLIECNSFWNHFIENTNFERPEKMTILWVIYSENYSFKGSHNFQSISII